MSGAGPHGVRFVSGFAELLGTPFTATVNALCWERSLAGDFAAVIAALGPGQGIVEVAEERLESLPLDAAGRLAAEAMLADLQRLRDHDLAPSLNCVYDCLPADDGTAVPTDVTSFHVDSAPVEVDTWLCTYHGASSEGLSPGDAVPKVELPEIRAALLMEYGGADDAGFAEFLHEHSYDSHYAPRPGATPYAFGTFALWRIATRWPGCPAPPCVHRAPANPPGAPRLLLIS
ncbi:MAG: hypothetical protein RLZZ550_997 [Verrucomicrobiota bacterium]